MHLSNCELVNSEMPSTNIISSAHHFDGDSNALNYLGLNGGMFL